MLSINELNHKLKDAYIYAERGMVREFTICDAVIAQHMQEYQAVVNQSLPVSHNFVTLQFATLKWEGASATVAGLVGLGLWHLTADLMPILTIISQIAIGGAMGVLFLSKLRTYLALYSDFSTISHHNQNMRTAIATSLAGLSYIQGYHTQTSGFMEDWRKRGLLDEEDEDEDEDDLATMFEIDEDSSDIEE